ncbi:hypothetical protein FHR81_002771 [Actinoalloteichus hoggarensis]|uniref:Uncharacterized protein n=1 Tax=Actinoalloteichus hoggarensis TaxID=1470176 RepID=A0A221VY04_9PSEU|nr:hypothetical protein AHOG_03550 [Actinoalloteichus hoggarensis]MBB5921731.1 hypothetical protein [Actinoalloteichus hoggarensis]
MIERGCPSLWWGDAPAAGGAVPCLPPCASGLRGCRLVRTKARNSARVWNPYSCTATRTVEPVPEHRGHEGLLSTHVRGRPRPRTRARNTDGARRTRGGRSARRCLYANSTACSPHTWVGSDSGGRGRIGPDASPRIWRSIDGCLVNGSRGRAFHAGGGRIAPGVKTIGRGWWQGDDVGSHPWGCGAAPGDGEGVRRTVGVSGRVGRDACRPARRPVVAGRLAAPSRPAWLEDRVLADSGKTLSRSERSTRAPASPGARCRLLMVVPGCRSGLGHGPRRWDVGS